MDEVTKTENGGMTALEEAQRLDFEIKAEARNIAGSLLRIGRALKRMNEGGLYKNLGYGSLGEYSSAAVGLQERAAYNYIRCYETYGADFLEKHEQLGLTKLVALTQLNDVDRKELLDSGNVESMSTRELQEEIKRYKEKCEQLTFELETQKTPVEVLPKPEISEAEKEDIRKALAVELEEKHEQELREAVEAARADESEKNVEALRALDAVITDHKKKLQEAKTQLDTEIEKQNKSSSEIAAAEKAKKTAEKKVKEAETENKKLTAEIDALRSENRKLQARAETKPKPSGNKELLKYHVENVAREFTSAVEVVERFEGEEKEQFRAWLIQTVDNMKQAAEKIGG